MNPVELPMAPSAPEREAPAPADARRFQVDGMDCAACAQTVEKAVAALDGVNAAQVSFGAGTLTVDGDAPAARITGAVSRAGYRARPAERRGDVTGLAPFWRRDVRAASTTAAVLLLLLAVASSIASAPRSVSEPLYLLSMAVGGWPIARAAAVAVRRGSLDMNVLMALAAVGAVGIGAYAEGAWVLVLFAIGTALERLALERSRLSVESLMELAPAQARVLTDGTERLVDAGEVTTGMRFAVRPGERLALDGVVTAGASSVDQAPITGESVPVDKLPGDEVFAGTLNGQGALTVRVTRPAVDSTLSRVAALVEAAQASRAPAERFIDRFARIYTPVVLVLAVLVATVAPLVAGASWSEWFYRSLVLLVISCPCALVISTPVSIVSALAAAARKGVLIKGGARLERLADVRCVAFDKTGTLTRGELRVVDVAATNGIGSLEVLRLAASLESRSEHPIGRAIVARAHEHRLSLGGAAGFQALPGLGAEGMVDAASVVVGNHRLFEERGLCSDVAHAGVERMSASGCTAVMVARNHETVGIIGVADEPRESAAAVVDMIRSQGVEHVVLLTGDHESAARALAGSLGISDYRASLLPEDKVAAVEELRRKYGVLAMVGDGVNDAPALATADVGIAMGVAGSDAALETADVALMADELAKIPFAIRLSRAASRNIKVNIGFSLGLKLAFLVMAFAGAATLWMAVVADMGASLIVIANALRLLRE